MDAPRLTTESDDLTRRPNLRPIIWALILIITIGTAAAIGGAVLRERHRPPEFLTTLTRVELPAGQCFAPQPGDVLHITVIARDLGAQDIEVACLNTGPRPTWSGL